jgi:hypothetical protein
MNFLFWKDSKPGLTKTIRDILISEFHLGPESLAKLRVLGMNGKYAGRRVRMIRIFDPSLSSKVQGSKLKYRDLQEGGERGALRFEGRIEMDGPVYLTDRRPAV